jgi:hypothetical protein
MKRFLLASLAVLLLSFGASAQSGPAPGGGPTMSLTGVVYDVNGAVVVGGTKVLAKDAAGRSYEAATDDEGLYKLKLPLGVYSVRVSAPGFCVTRVERLRVVNSTHGKLSLDFVLEHEGCGGECGYVFEVKQTGEREKSPE